MRRGPSLAIVAVTAILLLHVSAFGRYVADDAAISLAYARHAAQGDGLVLTPGDAPVEAYSDPLWVALLAVGALTGAAAYPVWLLKALGTAFALATMAGAVRLSRDAYDTGAADQDGRLRYVAPLLIATSTPFAFWAVAGLENALYACLVVFAASCCLREVRGQAHAAGSALLLVLLSATRPEGIALAAAFLVYRLLVREPFRQTVWWLAILVVPCVLLLLWRHWYFDAWLPNTFYAKVGATFTSAGGAYVIAFAASFPVLLALSVAGIADVRHWRANLLFAGLIATQLLFILYVGGDWWPAFRFLTVLIPVFAVLAQHGAGRLLRPLHDGVRRTAALALVLAAAVFPNVRQLAALWRVDQASLISLDSRLALALRVKTLAAIAHVPRPLLLEPDIGGPSLAGGLRLIDLAMLADVHLARFHYYAPFFRQYVFAERRPDFIHTHSVWTRTSRLPSYPELRRDYLTVVERSEDAQASGLYVRKDRFVRAASAEDVPIAQFGEMTLVGFEAAPGGAAAGQPLAFTWEWRCSPSCTRDYRLHVRLAGAVTSFNPVFGWYAADRWQANEVIRTTQDVHVPDRLAPGDYDLEVAAAPAGQPPAFLRVGSVRVGRAEAPREVPPPPVADPGAAAHLTADARQLLARHQYAAAFALLRRARDIDPASPRIVHLLEEARERAAWIDYYVDTHQIDRLWRAYAAETAAGALPADRRQQDKLYFALLPDADPQQRAALRQATGHPGLDVALVEDGRPALTLLDAAVDRGEWGVENRLQLFFDVRRAPARDYQIWIHAYASDGRRFTAAIDPQPATHAWVPGEIRVESTIFHLPPGAYDLRVGLWQPAAPGRMCPAGDPGPCYLPLGTRTLLP